MTALSHTHTHTHTHTHRELRKRSWGFTGTKLLESRTQQEDLSEKNNELWESLSHSHTHTHTHTHTHIQPQQQRDMICLFILHRHTQDSVQ
ncbi:hypothetical protein PGIGA_G00194690 [Pangasianodon gigas]|uniref:Uncharacterized protein n=1 Tax=Pangasianodon gigas TaxID=30993 RepID=A0ACC5XWG1_PANGG|nr:hypothetical protein [Pangasianodon gigas]